MAYNEDTFTFIIISTNDISKSLISKMYMGKMLAAFYQNFYENIDPQISDGLAPLLYAMWIRPPRWSRGCHTRHWIRGSRFQTRPGSMDFFQSVKNPEYDFLR